MKQYEQKLQENDADPRKDCMYTVAGLAYVVFLGVRFAILFALQFVLIGYFRE